jgi:putative copper resistance protein D
LGIALGAALIFLSRGKGLRAPGRSWLSQAVMAMSGMLLVTLAWAGHGASGVRFHDLHLGADVLHLATGAIWPMGLIPMAGFLWQLQRSGRELPRAGEIEALERFSRISLGAVVVIVLTGVINGWLMVGSWEALVTTTYGWLLVGKLALVGMMIGFGALNRLYLLPRIESETILFRMLQKTVLAESGLAAIVLLIVGMMGMTAPPS